MTKSVAYTINMNTITEIMCNVLHYKQITTEKTFWVIKGDI